VISMASPNADLVHEIDYEMSKRSFKFFFEEIMEFQLSHHHADWVHNLDTHNRYCVKAARDHGKSTLFLCYLLWKVAFNPKTDSIIFSHSLDQSIRHMRTLNDLIDSVPWLADMKKKDSWAKTFFGFKNGSRISAKSVGGAVRGAHPDIILCDDILWGTTETELQKVASWFYEVMIPTLHHSAKLMIVGTPFTPTDLYTELESKDGYLVETYPAMDAKGVPLWPERWSLEALDARRADMPAIAFAREYLCEPMDDMSSLFPSHLLQAAKDTHRALLEKPDGEPDDQYFIGWDPAISSDRQADYTVMLVVRRPASNPELLELVHVVRRKGMDFRTQIMEIQRLNNRFQPDIIELEANHFQRVFATELRADTDLPIRTFISTKQKRESLLMGLVLRFEREQMRLPWGDDRSRDIVGQLEKELLMFGMSKKGRLESIARHDDFAIALALANWATTEFRERIVDLDELMEGLLD
tara:strand:+ start:2471 stop:3880 length:1410 start_codon:yes stop_codon:yes gene_type:complete